MGEYPSGREAFSAPSAKQPRDGHVEEIDEILAGNLPERFADSLVRRRARKPQHRDEIIFPSLAEDHDGGEVLLACLDAYWTPRFEMGMMQHRLAGWAYTEDAT